MMKNGKKLLKFSLAFVLAFSLMAFSAYAETGSQDGLELTVSTNKTAYGKKDTISVEVQAKNTGEYDLLDVEMEVITPKDYKVKNGLSAQQNVGNMRENAAVSMTVDLTPSTGPTGGGGTGPTGGGSTEPTGGGSTEPTGGSSTEPTGGSSTEPTGGSSTEPTGGGSTGPTGGGSTGPTGGGSTEPTGGSSTGPTGGGSGDESIAPETGDETNLTGWFIVLGIAIVGIIAVIVALIIFLFKNGTGGSFLSMILVFFMLTGTVAAGMPRAEAANSVKEIIVTKIVQVDSKKVPIACVATYRLSERITRNRFTVSFNSNGGSNVAAQTVSGGERVTEPETPTRSGYRFVAWYSDADLTTVYDFNESVVSDLTLYACWEEEIPEIPTMLDEPEAEVEIYSFDTDTRIIPVNESQNVLFCAEIFTEYDLDENAVALYEEEECLAYLHDDGQNGDLEENDGLYSASVTLMCSEECEKQYTVRVNSDIRSETIAINYYCPISDVDEARIQEAEAQIIELCGSGDFSDAQEDEKVSMLQEVFDSLAASGVVLEGSVEYDDINGTIVYQYFNGRIGSVVLREKDENWNSVSSSSDSHLFQASSRISDNRIHRLSHQAEAQVDHTAGRTYRALVLNAFENTPDRRDFYNDLETEWDAMGLETDIDVDVTVRDMRALAQSNYDVIVFAMHGTKMRYGSYTASAVPVLLINEEVTADTDSDYSYELDTARSVYKAIYAGTNESEYRILPNFFYAGGRNAFDGKIIYSESCMFYGCDCQSRTPDQTMANAFIDCSAEAVVGYHNSVGMYYSRDTMKAVITGTFNGESVGDALSSVTATNPNDRIEDTAWDKYIAYPICIGNSEYVLRPNGSIAGAICSAADSTSVQNALIRVYDNDNHEIAHTRTDQNGFYSLDVSPGTYIVKVSAGSFKSAKMSVTVAEGETTYNETFLMLHSDLSWGFANGMITDSVNGNPVRDVTIKVRMNWNNRTGPVLAAVSTNENGYYELSIANNLICGAYTIEYSKSGYVTGYKNIVLSPVDFVSQDAAISPVVSDGVYRIVLSWGQDPRDMDSHLEGEYSNGDSFHVFYRDKNAYESGSQVCNLDLDDVTSYGPETVTLYARSDKDYYYYVHKYAGDGTTASSGSKVVVYKGNTVVQTLNVPTDQGDGRIWNAFAIKQGRIVVKNTITDNPDTTY